MNRMELQCKRADDLTKEINTLIKDMKASGEYDKLYEKWIGQNQKSRYSKSEDESTHPLLVKKEGRICA